MNFLQMLNEYGINFENYQNNMQFESIDAFLKDFYKELIDFNSAINITAITSYEDFIIKHILDSLLALKYIKDNDQIIDIGTGGGFPALPIAVFNKQVNVIANDSVQKKLKFIDIIKDKYKLNNISALWGRCEDLANKKEYREVFDVCLSRAVAKLNVLVEYTLPFVKLNGIFIAFKSIDSQNEILEAKNAINQLGGKIIFVDNIEIVENDSKRTMIVIKKIKNTPNKYPRGQNKPKLNPIV